MTAQEFEERTGIRPRNEEFRAIHTVYVMSDLDKDEFCHWFKVVCKTYARENSTRRA